MFDFLYTIVDIGVWGTVAAAGVALFCVVVFTPQARLLPYTARILAACAGIGVAGFGAGHIHGAHGGAKADVELKKLRSELEAAAARNRVLSLQAQSRLVQIQNLQSEVAGYEQELSSGAASTCPYDPAYTNRLLRILDSGSQ